MTKIRYSPKSLTLFNPARFNVVSFQTIRHLIQQISNYFFKKHFMGMYKNCIYLTSFKKWAKNFYFLKKINFGAYLQQPWTLWRDNTTQNQHAITQYIHCSQCRNSSNMSNTVFKEMHCIFQQLTKSYKYIVKSTNYNDHPTSQVSFQDGQY